VHADKDKQCASCGRLFATPQEAADHSSTCSSIECQVECSHCGKLILKKNLKSHVDLVHKNTRRYECATCGKKFQTKHVLQCHMETHRHPSERNVRFSCETCGKGFANKTMFADHINIHTGRSPVLQVLSYKFECFLVV
jgi:KRAB domain-containing zinc finger protein